MPQNPREKIVHIGPTSPRSRVHLLYSGSNQYGTPHACSPSLKAAISAELYWKNIFADNWQARNDGSKAKIDNAKQSIKKSAPIIYMLYIILKKKWFLFTIFWTNHSVLKKTFAKMILILWFETFIFLNIEKLIVFFGKGSQCNTK